MAQYPAALVCAQGLTCVTALLYQLEYQTLEVRRDTGKDHYFLWHAHGLVEVFPNNYLTFAESLTQGNYQRLMQPTTRIIACVDVPSPALW